MANLDDSGDAFPSVYQFEQTDPLLSGPPNEATGAGMDNIPHLQLARRTRWLKTRVDQLLGMVVNATTNVAGIVRLNNTVTSESVDQAATANAVRLAHNASLGKVPETRRVDAAGLATGGGQLVVNRTINVPKASPQQARDGVADDVAMTPLTTRAAIDDALLNEEGAAFALAETQISTEGLLSGGGTLDGDLNLKVEEASHGDAVTGTGTGTVTARRLPAAVAALFQNLMANIDLGAVGSPAFLAGPASAAPGDLVPGSQLQWTGALRSVQATAGSSGSTDRSLISFSMSQTSGVAVSGTWMCLGRLGGGASASSTPSGATASQSGATLWRRVL